MKKFEKRSFAERLKSMLKVDARRLFISPFFYITIAISFVVPVLILVMTTMTSGNVSVKPDGSQTVMQGFENVWQIIGSVSVSGAAEQTNANMDLVSMCNLNLTYFAIAVLVCIFVCADFKSGYAKNLFAVRAKKTDYVISKTIVGFIGSASVIIAFFIGAMLGGAISNLSFEMNGFNAFNLACSTLSKIALSLIFVAVAVTAGVTGKQKLWLSILLACGAGAFLFNIAPMVSPLNSGVMNVFLSLAGGFAFASGLGSVSNLILKKTSLV